ncbi:hypothetical protein QQP08_002416 [Theobroma cacao]|nr:hypothetical protein QQP08_002416 [Theobroma cacao]
MVGYGRMYIEDGGVEMVRYVIACSSHLWILLLKSRVAALVSSLFIPEISWLCYSGGNDKRC